MAEHCRADVGVVDAVVLPLLKGAVVPDTAPDEPDGVLDGIAVILWIAAGGRVETGTVEPVDVLGIGRGAEPGPGGVRRTGVEAIVDLRLDSREQLWIDRGTADGVAEICEHLITGGGVAVERLGREHGVDGVPQSVVRHVLVVVVDRDGEAGRVGDVLALFHTGEVSGLSTERRDRGLQRTSKLVVLQIEDVGGVPDAGD